MSRAAAPRFTSPLEGRLHCFEIRINIGMIEFDVREDECVGKVVQKFWALVEEGVSYSSPSTMKVRVGRSWKLVAKFSATPPMRNDGSRSGSIFDRPGRSTPTCWWWSFSVCACNH